ncbi:MULTISPECIES: glucokinase [Asticcacaulis]|uniref:Glucokinase n=1 Tax=Asticcacaulis endophyticus TaxID=1395890 RepID=A0A918PX14_9CAUL|nr:MULTISPECIES: glucokinase [Asticcacaulis]WKL58449.1 glucokinase [Asticcacaulis sp. ZE23SCel15]GGZ24919.1 glucokinase [Asticcacaulis endophyticus]
MGDQVLLCDLSMGSHVNLALADPGHRPQLAEQYECAGRSDLDGAIRDFLKRKDNPRLKGAAVSSRGWEDDGIIHLPEGNMTLSRDELRQLLDIQRVNLVNNFVARALAIPTLKRNERSKICGGENAEETVIAVLGPHYGLGLAALVADGAGGWTALPGEGGHSDLPVKTDREWAVLKVMQHRFGHVSREMGISLNGLCAVWETLSLIDGVPVTATDAAGVVDRARSGDRRAQEAIGIVTDWLAGMASDVALIMGARGGIYLTGALLDLIDDLFDAERFCRGYLNKGTFRDYVHDIPVFRTTARQMEITGLATLF